MKLRTKVIIGIVAVACIGGGTILASTKAGRNAVEWVATRGSSDQQKKEYVEQQKLAESKYGKSDSSSKLKKKKTEKKKSVSKKSKSTSSSSSGSNIDTDTITVVYGDSLSSIALSHDMTVKELIALNDMENTTLRPGQTLKVVAGSGRSTDTTSSDTTGTDNTSSDNTTSDTSSSTSDTTSSTSSTSDETTNN